MFVKIAQAAVRQAKLATFSVETLIVSPTLLELSVYMTRLGSAHCQYAWSAWRCECLSGHRSARQSSLVSWVTHNLWHFCDSTRKKQQSCATREPHGHFRSLKLERRVDSPTSKLVATSKPAASARCNEPNEQRPRVCSSRRVCSSLRVQRARTAGLLVGHESEVSERVGKGCTSLYLKIKWSE